MKKLLSLPLLAALSALPALGQSTLVKGEFVFTTFAAPAGTPAGNNALGVQGINDVGAITGVVFAGVPYGTTPIYGYLRSFNGATITELQDPASDGLLTLGYGINDLGTVAGTYFNVAAGHLSGFTYKTGTYTSFDVPGLPAGYETYVMGINNRGVLCGYTTAPGGFSGYVPFVDNNGTIDTNFNIPTPGATVVQATSINDFGAVVGTYVDPTTNMVRGYLRGTNGGITLIDVPGAAFIGTEVFGINDLGWISGDFYDAENHRHGFLRAPEGTYYQIDVPGAATDTAAEGTAGAGLNNFGAVVGHYDPADGGPERGYIALLVQR